MFIVETRPLSLLSLINTPSSEEHSASLSADSKYLFFMSARMPAKESMPERLTYEYISGLQSGAPNGNPAIYWVDAAFIDKLRPK